MKPTETTPRRSDEIRRRRAQQSHAGRAAGEAAASQPARQPAHPSLLNRLLGGQTSPRRPRRGALAQRAATPPPASSAAALRSTRRSAPRSAATQPPVLMRGASAPRLTAGLTASRPARNVASTSRRSAPRSRKLYNLTLNGQGAEMRLPALPRPRMSWRAASLLLLAFLGAALYALWTLPNFQVEAAQVSGLKRLTGGLVNKELGLTGKPIFTLDADQIQQELLTAFPEFSAAQVSVDLPNTVLITVTERVPALIWQQDGRDRLVDADGMTFPARQDLPPGALPSVQALGDPPLVAGRPRSTAAVQPADDPTLEAIKQVLPETLRRRLPDENQASPLLTPEMVQAILAMSEMAPTGAQIVYDKLHGFGWQDRRGWMVYFGDFADMEMKLQVYRAVLDTLKSSGVRPELISLEYVYAPFYRVKQEQ